MPRYSLRTLLILLAIGPPLVAGTWLVGSRALANYRARRNAVVWEDVGGVVSIQFETEIRCYFNDDPESASGVAGDDNP